MSLQLNYWNVWKVALDRGSILASHPAAPGYIPSFPQKIQVETISMWLRCWLEKSGQWLGNVDRTHLVMTSGKLVLQKKLMTCSKPLFSFQDPVRVLLHQRLVHGHHDVPERIPAPVEGAFLLEDLSCSDLIKCKLDQHSCLYYVRPTVKKF